MKNKNSLANNVGASKKSFKSLIFCVALLAFVTLLENSRIVPTYHILFEVIRKGAVYSLVAVSMNLLNGFTGLFSLGQAGFMLLGAYTYGIFMVPTDKKSDVYRLVDGGSAIKFSFPELYGNLFGTEGVGGALSLILGALTVILLAGCVAAIFAYIIGLPVLRLKSDYLAIATLGFAEIIMAVFQWETLGPITNGANIIKDFPGFSDFNIKSGGNTVLYLSCFMPVLLAMICIAIIVLLINSSYGRSFKAIRDDEIAAEAIGINLAKHKMLSFCISSFFAGIGGALFAMYAASVQAKMFTSAMTYEILLIVVIGGIGSVSGSCIASFLYVACSEWLLRFLDNEITVGTFKVPLLKNGFRMVVFSIIIMIVVLFFRNGIMGSKELSFSMIKENFGKLFSRKAKKNGNQNNINKKIKKGEKAQ